MTNYADLVSRLKLRAKHVSPDYVLDVEAADAIETMVKQVEDAKSLLGGDGGMKTLRALRKDIEALVRERDELMHIAEHRHPTMDDLLKEREKTKAAERERDEARANEQAQREFVQEWIDKTETLGAAIKRAEAAEARVAKLKEALAPFVTITKTDGPVWYYENADDSVVVRCEITVGEIRHARTVLEAGNLCACQIEMATFRAPGSTCAHCGKPIGGKP